MNQQKRHVYLQMWSLYLQRSATEPFNSWLFLRKCVAACCSVLQRVAACCSVLQRVAVRCSVLHGSAGEYPSGYLLSPTYPQKSPTHPQKSGAYHHVLLISSHLIVSHSYPIKPRVYHTRTFTCVCVCVCVTLCMRNKTHKNKCTSIHVAHVPQPPISFCVPHFPPFQKMARAVHGSPRH